MIPEYQYQTPDGFHDVPYIYAFNGSNGITSIPTGVDVNNVGVQVYADSHFICRRVAGMSSICSSFMLRDAMLRRKFSKNVVMAGSGYFDDIGLIPEEMYPAGSQIGIDLGTTVLATRGGAEGASSNIPISQVIFQGVRRFAGPPVPVKWQYIPDRYSYVMPVTLNYTFYKFAGGVVVGVNGPQTFTVPITAYDFELHSLTISNTAAPGAGPGGGIPLTHSFMSIRLFDAGRFDVFSKPILDRYLMDNFFLAGGSYGMGVFSPPLVYPANSEIRMEITSLLDLPEIPQTLEIGLHGIQRVPL